MKSTTLKDLFAKPDIRFVIPEYQRAYTWGERQFSQFVEDLRECGKNYFLGHFLFEKSENTLYIIDGQQRLTTCVIFFSVLMNAIRHRQDESINAGNADDITGLLKNITDRYLKDNTSNRLKFTTVSYDNNFFIDAIIEYKESVHEEELTSKSRLAMRNARAYFENEMSKVSVPQMLHGQTRLRTHPSPHSLSRTSYRRHRFSPARTTEESNSPIWKSSRHISCYSFLDRGTTVTEQPI